MSAAFTPGPWRQRSLVSTVVLRDVLRVLTASGDVQTIPYEIAYARRAPGGVNERIANARLIAAAPELYEGAIDTIEAMKLLRIGLADHSKVVEVLDAHIDELEYATAKARGEQS